MRPRLGAIEMMTPKPIPLTPKPEAIPAELKSYRAWVMWRYEWVEGKWTKVPYQTDGSARQNRTIPSTWGEI